MTFATPWMFGLAALGALGVVGLHLLSVREPPEQPLPTARFVPGGSARAVARQPRLSDRRLLALRILALLAFGAAFSGVRCGSGAESTVELVYVDPSVLGDSLQWRAMVRADSAAVVTRVEAPLRGLAHDPAFAIVRALRDASSLVSREPEVEQFGLTVVVPGTVQTIRGWDAWRAQWPAQIRVVVQGDWRRPRPQIQVEGGTADDPVRAALQVMSRDGSQNASRDASREALRDTAGEMATRLMVRVVRDDTVSRGRGDSSGAAPAAVVVWWPRSGIPDGWEPMPGPDIVGALTANGRALVGPFTRRARVVASAGLMAASADLAAWRPVVWWSDGAVAAVEREVNGTCERQVAIPVPVATDLWLSSSARGVLDALVAPCGDGLDARRLRDSTGATPYVAASLFRQGTPRDIGSDPRWLMPVLLLLGVTALGAEWWWRARSTAS
jgi:hypothetical protein